MDNITEKYKHQIPLFIFCELQYLCLWPHHWKPLYSFCIKQIGLKCMAILKNKSSLNYNIQFHEHNYKYNYPLIHFWFQYEPQESQMCMFTQRSWETDLLWHLKCLHLALCTWVDFLYKELTQFIWKSFLLFLLLFVIGYVVGISSLIWVEMLLFELLLSSAIQHLHAACSPLCALLPTFQSFFTDKYLKALGKYQIFVELCS